jgi:hypothetical protein
MKWTVFTGTWRLTNAQVENDVRNTVREVLDRGDAIITGGALGVDLFTMEEAVLCDPRCVRLLVIIPAELEKYIDHFHKAYNDGRISEEAFHRLENVLRLINHVNPAALIQLKHEVINQEAYFDRDTEEIKRADVVHAFQVNNSIGTQDTIDKAKAAGLPVALHRQYTIEEL